jgi:hypothetical protein
MGVCDDWPYILMAQKLAASGHVAYNGWAAPMIGWQLYLGAAFVKMFGASLTVVRMSTLLTSMVLAFLLQRTLVRANISERNATIATLAFVLSPLYMVLSVTFMTDIPGLFAMAICFYGCLRALQATASREAIGWLCFAIASNALFGTARQIAWLGLLVMVPCTLWLLREQRRVVIAGAAVNAAGAIFVFGCLQWLKHQPYSIPEHVLPDVFRLGHTFSALTYFYMEAPLLLLPVTAAFLPSLRRNRRSVLAVFALVLVGYLFLSIYPSHLRGNFPLEPSAEDWVSAHGSYLFVAIHGAPPVFLTRAMQILLTALSVAGILGLIGALLRSRVGSRALTSSSEISWRQLGWLLLPFSIAYGLLLVARAADTSGLSDRYLLGLIVVGLVWLVRCFQDRVQAQLPFVSVLLVGMMAVWGVVVTHNTFSFYRGRAALAAEVRGDGVPDTAVDYGWEYNLWVELQHADHINFPAIATPADAYVLVPPLPAGTCSMFARDYTPHISPLYGASYDPDACYGLAPFAPVHYSRWPDSSGTLYVVRYTSHSK